MPFCLIVGGLKSPWKGEYREPRCLQMIQGTSLPESPLPPSRPMPESPASLQPLTRSPSPPLPCQDLTGSNMQLSLNGKECQGSCNSLQPTILAPHSPQSGIWVDLRNATFEHELQQLEFGKDETLHRVSVLLLKYAFVQPPCCLALLCNSSFQKVLQT